jgi:Asp-tRNA(Asn)/Glu-tRNA(Gln) amidotransferase A subunit family amidase
MGTPCQRRHGAPITCIGTMLPLDPDLTMTDLNALSTVAAAALIGKGEITSEALVAACLARIKTREGDVKAWAYLDPDHAIAQARAADAATRVGRSSGPLHGVPVAVKDIIDTADMPTECGSPVFKGRQPDSDAAVIGLLRAAGAIILGKTITTEMATLTPNITRNPVNLEHTPGGSSSGSAAAVADNMVPAALATQTGGSVIRPAAFCGIYGFKPTFGFIPRTGVLEQSHTIDTLGVYGRSVEDLALLGDVLGRHDPRDRGSFVSGRPNLMVTATSDPGLKPMFALVKTHAWERADAWTREAFGELAAHLGDQVSEFVMDYTTEDGVSAARTIGTVELAHYYGPYLDKHPDLISKNLTARIEEGRRISATAYVKALNDRERFYRTVMEPLTQCGTILTPAAPGPAPKGLESTGDAVFCSFWTYLGVPAVTLPLLEADGLPMGVQLIAARRDDGRLLRTARWLERALAA